MPVYIDKELYRKKIELLNCCVIVPTYNNEQTIAGVINDILVYTKNIIVVNDGSTDSTSEILKQFSNIEVLSYSPNKGKGFALRTALYRAEEKGYRYAITIDSDGQHFAEDIPHFISKISELPGALIIGHGIGVPGKDQAPYSRPATGDEIKLVGMMPKRHQLGLKTQIRKPIRQAFNQWRGLFHRPRLARNFLQARGGDHGFRP